MIYVLTILGGASLGGFIAFFQLWKIERDACGRCLDGWMKCSHQCDVLEKEAAFWKTKANENAGGPN